MGRGFMEWAATVAELIYSQKEVAEADEAAKGARLEVKRAASEVTLTRTLTLTLIGGGEGCL